ncbi:Nudix family hydrolase [Burkholderiales bacterium]|nr:Nudix family hydrolase [Burkholderiales bacterium]
MIHVVAGIIFDSDGHFLLARRPIGKVYEGFWEFPGGKVEKHESTSMALVRELEEELGITPQKMQSWVLKKFRYPHGDVKIEFFKINHWQGEIKPLEGQKLHWQKLQALDVAPILEPNIPILKSLHLPDRYLITNLVGLGQDRFFQLLSNAVRQAPQYIQIREKDLSISDLEVFTKEVLNVCRTSGSKVLLNGHIDLGHKLGVDGIHLTSTQLKNITQRPDFELCAGSCHDKTDLEKVDELELDFAVLSPVKTTSSHPEGIPLGWKNFNALLDGVKTPVYALGGLSKGDLEDAWTHGAVGVAMIRGAW